MIGALSKLTGDAGLATIQVAYKGADAVFVTSMRRIIAQKDGVTYSTDDQMRPEQALQVSEQWVAARSASMDELYRSLDGLAGNGPISVRWNGAAGSGLAAYYVRGPRELIIEMADGYYD